MAIAGVLLGPYEVRPGVLSFAEEAKRVLAHRQRGLAKKFSQNRKKLLTHGWEVRNISPCAAHEARGGPPPEGGGRGP